MERHTKNFLDILGRFAESKLAILTTDDATESLSEAAPALLVAPAQGMTSELLNSMLHLCGAEVGVALSPARTESLLLSPMSAEQKYLTSRTARSPFQCVSVEARVGVTTGISTSDRANTISLLGSPAPDAKSLVKPGHIFPVCVREGGVLVRNALPEGALDLVRLAGFTDAAATIPLLNQVGETYTGSEIQMFASKHRLPILSLGDLIAHRLQTEQLVQRIASAKLPTHGGGELTAVAYQSLLHSGEHVALVKGTLSPEAPVLTRVQAESTFEDVFGGSSGKSSRDKIQETLAALSSAHSGVFVYLRRADSGQLAAQVAPEAHGNPQFSSPTATMQEYGIGAQILRDLGVRKIQLLTTSRAPTLRGLDSFGLEIVSSEELSGAPLWSAGGYE